MNNNTQPSSSSNNDEIDLKFLLYEFQIMFNRLFRLILQFFIVLKKNIISLLVLMLLGFGVGYLIEELTTKGYKIEVIVKPNFNCLEYLKSSIVEMQQNIDSNPNSIARILEISPESLKGFKIDIKSNISKEDAENDLKALDGLKNEEIGNEDKTHPAIDILREKILKQITLNHKISFYFSDPKTGQEVSKKIIKYLNQNIYYKEIKDINLKNLEERLLKNTAIIDQIDELVSNYSKSLNRNSDYKNEKHIMRNLVQYEKENSLDLTDLIELRGKIIQNVENSKRLLIEQKEIVTIVYFGSTQLNNSSKYSNIQIKIPFILIGLFFILLFLRYLNKKSNEI